MGTIISRGRITDPYAILDFLFAGRAVFTLQSTRTGTHFTFRMRRAKDKDDFYFLDLLTGPSNESDFQYIGTLSGSPGQRISWKFKYPPESPALKGLEWFLLNLYNPTKLAQAEFYHESKCGRCGRTLTVPSSVETGIGPECAKKQR